MKLRADLARQGSVIEIEEWHADVQLRELADACIARQRDVVAAAESVFEPAAHAKEAVAPAALEALRASGRDVHGIAREAEISNVVTFNASHIDGSLLDRRVNRLRGNLDAAIEQRLRGLFPDDRVQSLNSGDFWYPPGGYMGWHTNSQVPGWRLYVTRTDTPDQSFFRYCDPENGEIQTSMDSEWNSRLFRISADEPFWHAVYSETNRFSFGFMIVPWSLRRAVIQHLRSLRSRLGGLGGLG